MFSLSTFVCPFICKGWGNKRKLLDKKPAGTLDLSTKWQSDLKIKIFVDTSERNFHKVRALTFCCGRFTSKAKLELFLIFKKSKI